MAMEQKIGELISVLMRMAQVQKSINESMKYFVKANDEQARDGMTPKQEQETHKGTVIDAEFR
jgi:hypothetical protein